MKTTPFRTITILIILFIVSCSQSSREAKEASQVSLMEKPSESSPALTSSSAAVETGKDSTRKFIRTAELKFKAKSVVNTTYSIEDIVTRMGGFVTLTQLKSDVGSRTVTPVSADSSLETTWFTVTNNMVIRVPNTALDSTLKSIAPLIDFLDYRNIQANDVALDLLSNRLAQKRAAKHEERVTGAIDNRGRKLNETINAEELLLRQQEQSDAAKLANMKLNDQVQFSTINLMIYQSPSMKRELVYNDKNIEAYRPGLGHRLADAFISGWNMLAAFLVFITGLWGFILAIIVIYILYRKYGHRLRNK